MFTKNLCKAEKYIELAGFHVEIFFFLIFHVEEYKINTKRNRYLTSV